MVDYKFYIDMDGVFVDFLQGCANYFGVAKRLENDWPKGEWGNAKIIEDFFGVSEDVFWDEIGYPGFWSSLTYTLDGKAFLDFIYQYKPTILTTPCYRGADGKQMWIRKNMTSYWRDRRYIFTPQKHHVSGPGKVLIDDSDRNIKEWEDYGGIGILYPRPWNRLHFISNPLSFVKGAVNHTLFNNRFEFVS